VTARTGIDVSASQRLFPGLLVCLLAAGCAVPVPPSGGPTDTQPPRLRETTPRQGATLVTGRSVEIAFSEAVDRSSFARAWSITPDMPGPADLSWDGFDRVRVSFPEPFRDATTYIFTIDTALRDVRNVALNTPISLAFATGDALDGGRLSGRVLDPTTGNPVSAMDVLLLDGEAGVAYPPRVEDALYRTQTGPNGNFSLDFLAVRPYAVVAHGDRNRNGKLDSGERWAVASERQNMPDSAGVLLPRPLWPVRFDTTAPQLVRIRAVSKRDLELRLSEPVTRVDSADLVLVDSVGTEHTAPAPFPASDRLTWMMRTREPLARGPWQLRGNVALTDSSGLSVAPGSWPFTMRGTEPDAPPARIVRVRPDSLRSTDDGFRPLWPRDSLVLVWSAPPDGLSGAPPDSLVAVQDTTGRRLPVSVRFVSPIHLAVSRPAPANVFRLLAADTSFTFRIMGPADTGDIIGTVQAPAPTIIELYAENDSPGVPQDGAPMPLATTRVPEGTQTFRFDRLPGGLEYRLRAFADLDGNGRWTPSRVEPWMAAEPLIFARGTDPVRARWESVRADTLTFPE